MTGLLIFIGLILIILNVLAIKKQNKSFNGVLGNAMGNIHDNDIIIGELRREFSENILELQSELMKLKEDIERNNKTIKRAELTQDKGENKIIIEENNDDIIMDKPSIISPIEEPRNATSQKVDEIKRLFCEGLSLDEISEILHLGKGEVLLIKNLYIK
ncbi:hypothetical protein LGK95_00090 [Clostridium algoriphilum]|uniref:DUF6115 domain-containing protein n=1 Tax=Clostridium algoriphilum TaxID=198347 RepID=UPI001CF13AA6|nr:hypothetical protein [Clostridium algoriphilum]MCB2291937.1 hypothetical protein [Clostridium algoriphilum]